MSFLAQALGSRPSTGDIEFWHGAERSGWLMKQGEWKVFFCERAIDASKSFDALFLSLAHVLLLVLSQSRDRGVYQDVEAPVSDEKRKLEETKTGKMKLSPAPLSLLLSLSLALPTSSSLLRSTYNLSLYSWFILKQGKIFWFKSDQVTPVSVLFVCVCVESERQRQPDPIREQPF